MLFDQIKFAFKTYPIRMWIIVVCTIVVLFSCAYEKWVYEKFQWFDPIIGGMTFLVSLFIFINQIRMDWETNLQKRISVFFEYGGRVVMKFENGVIPDGTDLRAWSQQIGAQMGKSRNLQFEPSVEMGDTKIHWDKIIQRYYKIYPVTYLLTELPTFETYQISPKEEPDKAVREQKEVDWRRTRMNWLENNAINWYCSFDNRGKATINRIPKD